jgi:hypothetical protein
MTAPNYEQTPIISPRLASVKRSYPVCSEATYRNFFNKYRIGNPREMAEPIVRRAANRFEILYSN